MMALAGLWSLFNLVVLVLLVVLAIFGIQALRKYLKTPQEVEAWEKDTADPTDQQLMDLAALYGGTLADLFRR